MKKKKDFYPKKENARRAPPSPGIVRGANQTSKLTRAREYQCDHLSDEQDGSPIQCVVGLQNNCDLREGKERKLMIIMINIISPMRKQ